jgi:hypothetical protein
MATTILVEQAVLLVAGCAILCYWNWQAANTKSCGSMVASRVRSLSRYWAQDKFWTEEFCLLGYNAVSYVEVKRGDSILSFQPYIM